MYKKRTKKFLRSKKLRKFKPSRSSGYDDSKINEDNISDCILSLKVAEFFPSELVFFKNML